MHVFRLLSRRSTVAVLALSGAAAFALPAGATTTTTTLPAHGFASSNLTILRLHLAGQSVSAGQIAMVAGNNHTPHTAQLVITPLSSTATGPIGQQTVTAGGGTSTVPATPKTLTLPNGLGTVTGPTFAVQAKDSADSVLAAAQLSALGNVDLTTLPLSLSLNAADLSDTAQVTASRSSAVKSLSLGNLSLPSLSALLDALGIKPKALLDQVTQGKLTALAGMVPDPGGLVAAANSDVDAVQAQLSNPADTVVAAKSELTDAEADVTQAIADFDSAWTAAYDAATTAGVNGLVDAALTTAGVSNPPSVQQFSALQPADVTALKAIFDGIDTTIWTSLSNAADAVASANDVVTLVNQLIDALQALVDAVVNAISNDQDPIASLGGMSLVTKAVASKSPTATASVKVATINVLGVTTSASSVAQTLVAQLSPLTDALNSVAGVSFTPPKIAIGAPQHGTSTRGRTRHAFARVSAVTVTLPTITLPSALQAAGAPAAVSGSLSLGVLGESAAWTPAVSHTVTTPDQPTPSQPTPTAAGGPQLSDTGGRVALPIIAVMLIVGAAALRRRLVRA